MPVPAGPESDAQLFVRLLQQYNLTYDSNNIYPEVVHRPDLVFCEYVVEQQYLIKPILKELPLPVIRVNPSFYRVYPYCRSHIIKFYSRVIADDGTQIESSLEWPKFVMEDGTYECLRTECMRIFDQRFIQLSNTALSINLRAGKVPFFPSTASCSPAA